MPRLLPPLPTLLSTDQTSAPATPIPPHPPHPQALGDTMFFFDSQREGYLPPGGGVAWRGDACTADYNTSASLAALTPNMTSAGFGSVGGRAAGMLGGLSLAHRNTEPSRRHLIIAALPRLPLGALRALPLAPPACTSRPWLYRSGLRPSAPAWCLAQAAWHQAEALGPGLKDKAEAEYRPASGSAAVARWAQWTRAWVGPASAQPLAAAVRRSAASPSLAGHHCSGWVLHTDPRRFRLPQARLVLNGKPRRGGRPEVRHHREGLRQAADEPLGASPNVQGHEHMRGQRPQSANAAACERGGALPRAAGWLVILQRAVLRLVCPSFCLAPSSLLLGAQQRRWQGS